MTFNPPLGPVDQIRPACQPEGCNPGMPSGFIECGEKVVSPELAAYVAKCWDEAARKGCPVMLPPGWRYTPLGPARRPSVVEPSERWGGEELDLACQHRREFMTRWLAAAAIVGLWVLAWPQLMKAWEVVAT